MNGVAFIHIQYFSYLEHVTSFFAIPASCPKLENCASAQKNLPSNYSSKATVYMWSGSEPDRTSAARL